MGYFPVRYDPRVVIYERKMFIRLATGGFLENFVVNKMSHWRLFLTVKSFGWVTLVGSTLVCILTKFHLMK